MAAIDTVKAITTNLTGILTGLGWSFEETATDPDADTINFSLIEYNGEDFEETHGERSEYAETLMGVLVKVNRTSFAASREAQQEVIHAIRAAVNVNTLNVGDLASSKYVIWVDHIPGRPKYDDPISTMRYELRISYREK